MGETGIITGADLVATPFRGGDEDDVEEQAE